MKHGECTLNAGTFVPVVVLVMSVQVPSSTGTSNITISISERVSSISTGTSERASNTGTRGCAPNANTVLEPFTVTAGYQYWHSTHYQN